MAYQLSIFAENKPGRVERVTRVLKEAGINIRNIHIASAGEFGLIQLLVDDPHKAYHSLKDANIPVTLKEIIAVYTDDSPGGLHKIAEALAREGINLEDASGFVLKARDAAVVVIQVEKTPQALAVLQRAGFKILTEDEIYSL